MPFSDVHLPDRPVEPIDNDLPPALRIALFNDFDELWHQIGRISYPVNSQSDFLRALYQLSNWPLSELRYSTTHDSYRKIEQRFLTDPWNHVLDLLWNLAALTDFSDVNGQSPRFVDAVNWSLSRHNSAWRLEGREFVRQTDRGEIEDVSDAIYATSLKGVKDRLQGARRRLSERTSSPDYRSAAKEAIDALEGFLCRLGSDTNIDTAIKNIRKDPALGIDHLLSSAMTTLYKWSNDVGVRHGDAEGADIEYEQARLVLSTCSSLINYLATKARKSGIEI